MVSRENSKMRESAMLMGNFKAVIISTDLGELLCWKVKYSRPRNKLLGLSVRGRWIDSEEWEQFCKFTFWYVLWFYIFFWIMLTNFCFQSPNQRLVFFFLACCMCVGKGICPSRKLIIHMVLHTFQNFYFPLLSLGLWKWKVAGSFVA